MASDVDTLPSKATNAPEQSVRGGVVPHVTVSDANAAADFYKSAFNAEEVSRIPAQDGRRLMHCHLVINGGTLMMADGFPEQGHPAQPPQAFTLHLQVDDAKAWHDRAVDAGAASAMAPQVMFWGDLYGQVRDPFGILWSIGSKA